MKRFICIILSLIIMLSFSSMDTVIVSAYSVENYTYDDLDLLNELIKEQVTNMEAAHQIAESARHLGYSEEHSIIELAVEEYNAADQKRIAYQQIYNKLVSHWNRKVKEYPTAAYIWNYFRDLGYSNQVCAGILGNIMAEAGGNTLNINYDVKTSSYYGICQWSKTYSEVWGASLEEQCEYLEKTIQYELNTFGYAYEDGFDYEAFLELKNIEDVAIAFAKCYERCGSDSYDIREKNAVAAYNYFVG